MIWILLACAGRSGGGSTEAVDLTERLGAGEVRAGVVTDEAALFGGVSAEGQPGDIKIYNDRVQFVIQSVRDSSYYINYGGGILDADIVRDAGVPGRDVIDDLGAMVGLGRLMDAERVSVIATGSDGGPAIVRAEGPGAPMLLLTGALESDAVVPERDVWIRTDYVLYPDSWLMEMHTTATWADAETTVMVGDLAMVGLEVADTWMPGRGLEGDDPKERGWTGLVGRHDEVALGLFSGDAPFSDSPALALLEEAAPVLVGLQGSEKLADGDTLSWTRTVGVGPDLATLSGAWHAWRGDDTETISGVVTAGGEPVAGARVHVLDGDGLPVTLATTDDEGRWSADVLPGEAASLVATGRGSAISTDLEEGAGWYGPYAPAAQKALDLASMTDGAPAIPFAEGFGTSDPVAAGADTTLTLMPPGHISVDTTDGRPAVVRVAFAEGDPAATDRALVPDRPSGLAALGFLTDGADSFSVEPGTYTVTVHRGLRWEVYEETVTVASGETVSLDAPLALACATPGVLAVDPHSHAAPSGDGSLPMTDRLVVHAAHGVDVHIGTDHDHVTDYRPLLAPLGLDAVLASVVSDEVSPVLRGHFNIYPLEEVPDEPNHGAVAWWEGVESTDALFAWMRQMAGGEDAILQVNHPLESSGMFSAADWDLESGVYYDEGRFSDAFDAVEVLNSGEWEDNFPYYLDLVNRGYDPVPTGVSDSHHHRDGVGRSVTYLHLGMDSVAEFTNDALRDAMRDHAAVVSHGPTISATVGGVWAPGQTVTGATTLDVDVCAPSWMPVERVVLYEDGDPVEVVAIDGSGSLSFDLDPASDASYVVVASADTGMSGAYPGDVAWAMTAALYVDVAGDGWDPPLPPLTPASR